MCSSDLNGTSCRLDGRCFGRNGRDDAVQRSGDSDLIATTHGSKDQLAVLDIDVGLILGRNVQGLDSLELKWAHGGSVVCRWLCANV